MTEADKILNSNLTNDEAKYIADKRFLYDSLINAINEALDISAVSCSLPSKEEIILQARKEENYIGNENDIEGAEKTGKYHGFLRGVEWLSDKIK